MQVISQLWRHEMNQIFKFYSLNLLKTLFRTTGLILYLEVCLAVIYGPYTGEYTPVGGPYTGTLTRQVHAQHHRPPGQFITGEDAALEASSRAPISL